MQMKLPKRVVFPCKCLLSQTFSLGTGSVSPWQGRDGGLQGRL